MRPLSATMTRALRALQTAEPTKAEEVARFTGLPQNIVHATLSRALKRRLVQRVGIGEYRKVAR